MSILNKSNCIDGAPNTGVCDCPFAMESIRGIAPVGADFKIAAADLVDKASAMAAIEDAIYAARRERLWPIQIQDTPTDNSQEPTKDTNGYGGASIVRTGFFDVTLRATDNSMYLAQQLEQFNKKKNQKLIIWDEDGSVWGYTATNGDFLPIPLELFYAYYKLPTPANVAQNLIEIMWEQTPFIRGYGVIALDPSFFISLNGLQNIGLKFISRASAVINIDATILGCGENLGEEFETEAENVANWTAVDSVTGTSLTISSIVFNATTGHFVFTLSASPINPAKINLVGAAELKTGGIAGYESTGAVVTT